MMVTRKLGLVTTILAVAGSGVAAAADAPVVSPQKTSASRHSPVLIPGTGIKKGEVLPKGAKLIYRDVTVGPKQKVTFSLLAPQGKTIRALAERDMESGVGFTVLNKDVYGHRHVDIRMYAHKLTHDVTQRMYALVR